MLTWVSKYWRRNELSSNNHPPNSFFPRSQFHRSSATLDAEAWCQDFYTDDIELRYANQPVLKGADVRNMFGQVFPQLEKMTHDVEYFDYVAPKIYQAASIRYRVKGDDPATEDIAIPGFATFFVRDDDEGKLKCYRADIFLDPSPVFQRIAERNAEKV